MQNSKLTLNTSTVTNIKRSEGTTTDCIFARVNVNGVMVNVTYERISKQVVVHRGFVIGRDACDDLIANLPAFFDERLDNIPDYPDSEILSALRQIKAELIDNMIIA